MKTTTLILALLALVAISQALTCQNYHHDKCVSVGCDIHCQGLGRSTGYCSYSGSWCTCNCVKYSDKFGMEVEEMDPNTPVPENVTAQINRSFTQYLNKTDSQPCDCMWNGMCYTCGGQFNAMVCYKGCGWKRCTSEFCMRNACSGRC